LAAREKKTGRGLPSAGLEKRGAKRRGASISTVEREHRPVLLAEEKTYARRQTTPPPQKKGRGTFASLRLSGKTDGSLLPRKATSFVSLGRWPGGQALDGSSPSARGFGETGANKFKELRRKGGGEKADLFPERKFSLVFESGGFEAGWQKTCLTKKKNKAFRSQLLRNQKENLEFFGAEVKGRIVWKRGKGNTFPEDQGRASLGARNSRPLYEKKKAS